MTARRNNDAERQQRQQPDGFHSASFPQEKSAQWSPHPLALRLLLRRSWQPFVRCEENRNTRELFSERGSILVETIAA